MNAAGTILALASAIILTGATGPSPYPRAVANDNRVAAGRLRGDTLELRLVVQRAEWYPEDSAGAHVMIEAFGEEGALPRIPAPLIRVSEGTVVHVTVRNALPDSTIHLIGFGTHPTAAGDTIPVPLGRSVERTFRAGAPGSYLYRAVIGRDSVDRQSERDAANGAFVVDPVGGSPPDRTFVMNIMYDETDTAHVREVLAINGRSWPHTERITAAQGDSLRWRVVNGTGRGHPMHLHGFYFQVEEAGDGRVSTPVPPEKRFLAVTEDMPAWSTRTLSWSPDRVGNWLFHCHLTFHVVPEVRLTDDPAAKEHQTHSPDPLQHMAGLVLGISVAPSRLAPVPPRVVRTADLWFNQGGVRGQMPATFSYILQHGATPPASDSVEIPGSLLLLTRGEATDITVHNRSSQAGGVHWHGIELESWSDGVMGWSSAGSAVAPAIMPGGSFTARLLTPRAGTFMYHTHMNDIEQVTRGAVGPIVVLEPGERWDPSRDHLYLAHWNGIPTGPKDRPQLLLINGAFQAPAPQPMERGVTQRFRLINIGPATSVRFTLRQDTTITTWTSRAKDGADLPPVLRTRQPAQRLLNVGEIYDFEFTPTAAGSYELSASFGRNPAAWRQQFVVR